MCVCVGGGGGGGRGGEYIIELFCFSILEAYCIATD